MNVSTRGTSKLGAGKESDKIDSRTKEKKHQKKKSKKKKKKSKKASDSSDDSSSASRGEWMEKPSSPDATPRESMVKAAKQTDAAERDEWMSLPGLFPSVTKERKQPKKPNDSAKAVLDTMGQSKYELNPYWKSGGTGLPAEHKEAAVSVGTVGDLGADWLRRALTRAKEQAKEEGRSLEEVAAERWGSLAKLETMLAEAESRSTNRSNCPRSERDNRYHNDRRDRTQEDRNDSREDGRYDRHRREEQRQRDARYDRREPVAEGRGRMDRSTMFQKPRGDGDDDSSTELQRRKYRRPTSSRGHEGGWRRKEFVESRQGDSPTKLVGESRSSDPTRGEEYKRMSEEKIQAFKKPAGESDRRSNIETVERSTGPCSSKQMLSEGSKPSRSMRETVRRHPSSSDDNDDDGDDKLESTNSQKQAPKTSAALSDKEMNDLGAKLVKAEILGNEELAAELKLKLDAARSCRALAPPPRSDVAAVEAQVVVLTRTDARGFTRPVSAAAEPYGGRQKKRKVETHDKDGQRVRYFPDDDRASLKEMFESEKMNSVEDSNKMFLDMASKVKPNDDMADLFEERACREPTAGKREARDRSLAIDESRRTERTLDTCHMCLDSKRMLKHLVISIGTKVYLSLPPQQSLTDGHCFIVPLNHSPCATQLDEDVWSEMQMYRRALTAMFVKMDQDVVFVETAMYLRKLPHMWLECVPMPTETGHLAPIYFKKAILECEMEWSTNRKLVDTSSKDVRRSIPKGLPYFSVDFGNEGGFAHVIEDESAFPRNFAQEIVGGMLDLDHRLWRKPQRESFDAQRKKVLQFAQWWKPHDFTSRKDSSDSDSS